MPEVPVISSSLPRGTRWVYRFIILCCLLICAAYISFSDWTLMDDTDTLLDLGSLLLFGCLAGVFVVRTSRKVDVYENRIVRKSLLGSHTILFKDIAGHHTDDRITKTLVDARGYFRGIVFKRKKGGHFSLNYAELTHFDEIKKYLRTRCKYYNKNAVAKLLQAEDRKLLVYVCVIACVMLLGLMH